MVRIVSDQFRLKAMFFFRQELLKRIQFFLIEANFYIGNYRPEMENCTIAAICPVYEFWEDGSTIRKVDQNVVTVMARSAHAGGAYTMT